MTAPSYTFRLSDLPKLDLQIDKGTEFIAWHLQWKSYCSLSGLSKEDPSRQVEALCFSRETLSVVQNLGLTDEQRKDVQVIIEALQSYVDGHLNETVERRNFRRRRQQSGETFDDYLISLRELAKTCKFCSDDCMAKNIRDQVIEGIWDGDTIESLLQEGDLSLAKTISICRSKQAAKKNRSDIAGPDSEPFANPSNQPITHHQCSQGVDQLHIEGDAVNVPHITEHVATVTKWVILLKYAVAGQPNHHPVSLRTNPVPGLSESSQKS